MIIDTQGRPLATKKPNTREIGISSVRDRWSTYPSDGLTPQRLAQIFKEADAGDVYRQMELFEEMEGKDAHLFSLLQTRKNAVTGVDFDVLPYADTPEDKRLAAFVEEQLERLEAVEDLFLDLLDAIGKGFSIAEILWTYEEGFVVPRDIIWRHPKHFFWDENQVLRVITEAHPRGIELPPDKYVIHQYKARSGHMRRAGVIRVAAWMYLFKNYDVKDWVAFCETFGMPVRLGKYGAGASEDDKEALMQALVTIGSDAAGIIPENASIEFKESRQTGSINLFESLANFCNKEMSKAILGQTLTTELGERGSYAASKTHDGVRQDLVEADCKALARTLKRDLIRPLIHYNFGETRRLPYLKFHCEPPDDLEKTANVYAVLVEQVKLPIPRSHLYDKFGIPRPEEGEETAGSGVLQEEPSKQTAAQEQMAMKLEGKVVQPDQEAIDRLADRRTQDSLKLFRAMYQSLEALMEEAASLEGVKELLEDPETLRKLQSQMESPQLEELLGSALYMADLMGRMLEDDGTGGGGPDI